MCAILASETRPDNIKIGVYAEVALREHAGQLWLYVTFHGLFEVEGDSGHHGHLGAESGSCERVSQGTGELTVRLAVKKTDFYTISRDFEEMATTV